MRQILSNQDLKTLMQGVAGVAASGLLMGAAMQPNLDGHPVQGPQILAPGGGERGDGPAGDLRVGQYSGQPPEYVIGTDWTRPRPVQYADAAPARDDTEVVILAADGDPPNAAGMATKAAWRDEPREPTRYPSQSGNAYYEANLPAPPAAPSADEADDADATDLG